MKLRCWKLTRLKLTRIWMENDFRINKINAKEEVEFHKKEINAIILAEIKGGNTDITGNILNLRLCLCERWKIKGKWKQRKLVVNVF